MQLEDYFDFLDPLDIRIKGTRIGIETILSDYLELGLFAEQIAGRYQTLTLEQVYATLTYYWHNKQQIDAYLQRVEQTVADQRQARISESAQIMQSLHERAQQQTAAEINAP